METTGLFQGSIYTEVPFKKKSLNPYKREMNDSNRIKYNHDKIFYSIAHFYFYFLKSKYMSAFV